MSAHTRKTPYYYYTPMTRDGTCHGMCKPFESPVRSCPAESVHGICKPFLNFAPCDINYSKNDPKEIYIIKQMLLSETSNGLAYW